jgi:EAL domain-containing protein (putative c-di-GMP-specific phosphodiesterase class I)
MLSPDHFIPQLEKANRIAGMTLHVVRSAIVDLKSWAASGHALTVAVNLSAILLEAPSFLEDLERELEESGVDPRLLTFEVTESAAMHAPDVAAAALARFKQLGIAISMDDYGTGQSTLTYLKRLPLDELKIDRSFVENAHLNRSDAVLVRSTINLAHELGLKVVAEGVETDECLKFLRSAGCDLAQGYLISSPVAAKALIELVKTQQRKAA